jgi:hypothetical protein
MPENNRDRFDQYRFATSDRDGHFSIAGVAPGVYKLFAWEALEENGYFDADLMRSLEALGKPASVGENDQLDIDVKVIPAIK